MSENKFFENAHREFLGLLSERDKSAFSACPSPDELLAALGHLKLLSTQRQKKTLNRCLDVMKRLNDKLQPYFDALNVIASTQDTVAFIYGALRLVLELASGFPSFFEKLLTVLGRLSDIFPQYSAIIELFDGDPPARMRRHLESVYLDLFKFIQMTTRIFTASSGKIKRPLGMITTIIWKPFDAQFSSLLNAMDDHRKFILDELGIHQAQQAKNSEKAAAIERERVAKEQKQVEEDRRQAAGLARQTEDMRRAVDAELRDSSIQRILEWLAPPKFVETLENSQEQREEGTAEWIFNDPAYKLWKMSNANVEKSATWNKMPPWFLWVHGNPGCGKTILASSVVEEVFDNQNSGDASNLTCYFFFRYDDLQSITLDSAYRSALAQILHRSRDADEVLDKFLFARCSTSTLSGQLMATPKELHDLVRFFADEFGQLILLLDGIDEAKEPELIGRKLKELATTSPVKIICFSRPNVNSLHRLVPQKQQIAVHRDATSSDIRIFLHHQLKEFMEDGKLPATANVQKLVDQLVNGADGMFLWAKLMVNHLNSFALSAHSRLAIINSVRFPEGLNAMYDRIIALITASETPQMELARRILLWIDHSAEEKYLTCDFLHAAVRHDDDHDTSEDFPSVVVSVCGGLVEFNPQHVFQFTHLTVKDYIKGGSWKPLGLTNSFVSNASSAAMELALRCLSYTLSRAPTEPPATFSGGISLFSLENRISFDGYAMRYWPLHLMHGLSSQGSFGENKEPRITTSVIGALSRFLDNPLAVAYWIEGMYSQSEAACHRISQLEHLLPDLHTTPWKHMARRLSEFSKELIFLDDEWGTRLLHNPRLIWDDVLVFSKTGILSKLGTSVEARVVTTMEPDIQTCGNGNVQSLCTISSSTSDERIAATLSTYPSSSFERFWKSLDPKTAYSNAEKFSSGWIAKYEVWSTDSKTRIASASITLLDSEIVILIRQSFRQNPNKNNAADVTYSEQDDRSFDTSFPLAISHDCRTFCILRTIYTLCPGDANSLSTGSPKSCDLPLESLPHFKAKWGAQLETFTQDAFASLPDYYQVSWRDWYTYTTSFSNTGRYLAFADYQMPCKIHIVIFEIVKTPSFSARLIKAAMIRSGPPRIREIIFHKSAMLIAFLSENRVWVWEIGSHPCPPKFLSNRAGECELGWETKCIRHNRPIFDCKFESVRFSACGRYLLARNKAEVEVFPVPEDIIAPKMITPASDARGLPPAADSCSETSTEISPAIASASFQPRSNFADFHVISVNQSTENAKTLLVTAANNELRLESVGSDSSSKNRNYLQILSLPKSFSTEDTSVHLRIPTISDDSLQIIFNKRAAESYSLSEGRQGQFPSIVERKLTSVAQIMPPEAVRKRVHPLSPEIAADSSKLLKSSSSDVSGSKINEEDEGLEN